MPSTVDKAVFRPLDKQACRAALELPANARLIGTAGGLYRNKGIGTLYAAWPRLAAAHPGLHLVLAGPVEAATPHPEGPRVHYLGALPHTRMAELFNAIDVGVMCIPDTPFGRYCFPQKAYEMLACGLPVVAADTGAMRALLAQTPTCLYAMDDANSLAEKVSGQLASPCMPDVPIDDWATLLADIEPRLRQLVTSHAGS
jgi:glycosyltransferase involved in cell wall biosynthesis